MYKYNKKLKQISRNLRHNQTDVEKLLWSKLRNRQLYGIKFRRQFPFDKYILDFYSDEKKLGIELDGSQHYEPDMTEKDNERDLYLNNKGIKVLRFGNNEVIENIDGVLFEISKWLK